MMEVNSLFSFSFGGKNDFGEEIRVAESKVMDFSSKPCGVGFAVRTGHEVDDFTGQKSIHLAIISSSEAVMTVEFKTEESRGAAEISQKVHLMAGENENEVLIPQDLSSPLKEVVFFFGRGKRVDDVTVVFDDLLFKE